MVRILDPPAEVDSRTLLCNDGSPSFGKVRASISVHKVVWLREPAVAFKERTTVGEEEHVQGTNISCNTTNGSVALYSVIAAASVRLYLGTRKGHTCITNQAYYPGQGASATVELTDFRASLADPRQPQQSRRVTYHGSSDLVPVVRSRRSKFPVGTPRRVL